MKYLLLTIAFLPTLASGQIIGKPFKKIYGRQIYTRDSIKPLLSIQNKKEVEKFLVGKWEFVNMKTPDGEIIDTLYGGSIRDNLFNIPEAVNEPNFTFLKDGKYKRHDIDSNSTGQWEYDEKEQILVLTLDEPYDSYMHFDSATKAGFDLIKFKPKPVTEDYINIYKVNKKELILITVCQDCLYYNYAFIHYKK